MSNGQRGIPNATPTAMMDATWNSFLSLPLCVMNSCIASTCDAQLERTLDMELLTIRITFTPPMMEP